MAELNSGQKAPSGPDQIQARILSELAAQGVKVDQPACAETAGSPYDREFVYGDMDQISIRQPTSDPDLLAFTTTLGVCSGEDTSLYIARREGHRWSLPSRSLFPRMTAEQIHRVNKGSGRRPANAFRRHRPSLLTHGGIRRQSPSRAANDFLAGISARL
jgi:hypothetical protein